jgi:hypothetical protein
MEKTWKIANLLMQAAIVLAVAAGRKMSGAPSATSVKMRRAIKVEAPITDATDAYIARRAATKSSPEILSPRRTPRLTQNEKLA